MKKTHIIIIDKPINWNGLKQELKITAIYVIGIITGMLIISSPM